MSGHCCGPERTSAPPAAREHRAGGPTAALGGPAAALGGPAVSLGGPAVEHPWVAVPAGAFRMGSQDPDANPGDGEGPVREVSVEAFAISAHAVTSRAFAAFTAATGYTTDAERFGWSFVFAGFLPGQLRAVSPRPEGTPWWCAVAGASWSAPEGPGSDLQGRADHPAVHVSWNDAQAYCAWAGVRLPTEVEWECAARGGLDQARFPWGDELAPGGEHRCNTWQGRFPTRNTAEDGWAGTCPVDAFPPNGYGLHNTSGNVWEWCADRWTVGGRAVDGAEDARVMRGGSYLCHDSYCNRYRVAARTSNPPDSGSGNNGFRVVRVAGGQR